MTKQLFKKHNVKFIYGGLAALIIVLLLLFWLLPERRVSTGNSEKGNGVGTGGEGPGGGTGSGPGGGGGGTGGGTGPGVGSGSGPGTGSGVGPKTGSGGTDNTESGGEPEPVKEKEVTEPPPSQPANPEVPEETIKSEGKTAKDAWNEAKRYVTEILKKPESASFPEYGAEKTSVTLSENIFTVESYVEAQNSRGIKIKKGYTCVLYFDKKGFWKIESFTWH